MAQQYLTNNRLPVTLIADNIRSLYNVGSLFRLADGVNLEAIYLCGLTGYPKSIDDPRPAWISERADKEIRKTGLAGVDTVPLKYFESTEAAVDQVKASGYQVVALEKNETSHDYRSVDYVFPLALIIGHETDGIGASTLERVDLTVHLPMLGAGHSLNVSTAAAAMIYFLHDRYESKIG